MVAIALAERRLVPEPIIRAGIRRFLRDRQAQEARLYSDREAGLRRFVERMAVEELAPPPQAANRQHYEVPTEFFQLVLGKHLKYSSGLWEPGTETLDEAEEAMLGLTCERADVSDGQSVLELGCGWGSLSLFMAARYPRSRIVGVSNSRTQGAFIRARAAERGLSNLEVRTADMNSFTMGDGERFDRIVSVEMFEHMRNWPELFRRVAGWLAPRRSCASSPADARARCRVSPIWMVGLWAVFGVVLTDSLRRAACWPPLLLALLCAVAGPLRLVPVTAERPR